MLWAEQLRKSVYFSYRANMCCKRVITLMTPSEVENNNDFSRKHSVQWNCKTYDVVSKGGNNWFDAVMLLQKGRKLLCKWVFLLGFMVKMHWDFDIKLYLCPCSMFHVLCLYKDVFKSFNVILKFWFVVWCVVWCDSYHFK